MHELALTSAIVEGAEEAANDRRVLRVTLEIGRLSGVMTEAIQFCFDEVARGTLVEGAVLDIREIDGRARCRRCGAEFEPRISIPPARAARSTSSGCKARS